MSDGENKDYAELAKMLDEVLCLPPIEYTVIHQGVTLLLSESGVDEHGIYKITQPTSKKEELKLLGKLLKRADNGKQPIIFCHAVEGIQDMSMYTRYWEQVVEEFQKRTGYLLSYAVKFKPKTYLICANITVYLLGIYKPLDTEK